MQRLKQWELKRAIYEKKALAKPETAKQGPNCIVSQMEVSLINMKPKRVPLASITRASK